MNQAWSKPVVPALGRQKLKDHKFEDTLGYIDGKGFKDRKNNHSPEYKEI